MNWDRPSGRKKGNQARENISVIGGLRARTKKPRTSKKICRGIGDPVCAYWEPINFVHAAFSEWCGGELLYGNESNETMFKKSGERTVGAPQLGVFIAQPQQRKKRHQRSNSPTIIKELFHKIGSRRRQTRTPNPKL